MVVGSFLYKLVIYTSIFVVSNLTTVTLNLHILIWSRYEQHFSQRVTLVLLLLQACKLKLGDLKGALLDTDFAIRDGENNVKAYFRQGQVGGSITSISFIAIFTSLHRNLIFKPSSWVLFCFISLKENHVNALNTYLSGTHGTERYRCCS